jgi:hypothetical protein
MRRVAPSVVAREELHRLLAGGADREANIVSAFIEAVTRLVVQELIEAEQVDYLGRPGSLRASQRWAGGFAQWLRARSAADRGGIRRCRGAIGARRDGPVPVVADEFLGRQ